ncbi:NAD(P)/FAD-dependent oxidoreductase [Methylohalobius crimeensis]|uniref:NAD(P)/FAD-dependent oxidoreductase n=1 Tax=Methylohalobius crimeensis TaxID=244365 RepID=UPI0003B507DF|nr:FAD-dependent oxidoreductase [Methylohalobius crimeensis]
MASPRLAVVGGGVAGLVSAWLLSAKYSVTLLERNACPGGHSHTVEIPGPDGELAVDTGFIVYNERNYPLLTRLFSHLGVASRPTDMSFAFSTDEGRYEWAGDNLNTLFAQRSNLLNPRHWRLLGEVIRFNRAAKRLLENPDDSLTLDQFLCREGLSGPLAQAYLLPMAAAIWSCPTRTMQEFPALSLCRFFHNHGLIDLFNRPQWRTVEGGSRRYVQRLLATGRFELKLNCPVTSVRPGSKGWDITAENKTETFDQVILACHADEAHALLANEPQEVRDCLAAFPYQNNIAWLHRDEGLMPVRRQVWSAWNYLTAEDADQHAVSVTYWMNRLQHLPMNRPVFVSLNPLRPPREDRVFLMCTWQHPVFDRHALAAQHAIAALQGKDGLWLAGSYTGHGFHEDAVASAVAIARRLDALPSWLDDQE